MLLTVTMNPSVDISYQLDHFLIDDVNRVDRVIKTAGGKGLNVTRVAHQLGSEVIATGVLGGTIGQYITNQLTETAISHDFYTINQESRNCIAILHEGKQTEILESGPTLSEEEADAFISHYEKLIANHPISVITLSGSLPKGLTATVYKRLIAIANQNDIPVVLDTSGQTLEAILDDKTLKLAAIKPNRDEISALEGKVAGQEIDDWEKILFSERYNTCEWVIVSMGGDGAIAKHQADLYHVSIPMIQVVNPVGSGDSTVAGIAKAISEKRLPTELLKTAMTAGMLNTMEAGTGQVNASLFDGYFDQVTVTKQLIKE